MAPQSSIRTPGRGLLKGDYRPTGLALAAVPGREPEPRRAHLGQVLELLEDVLGMALHLLPVSNTQITRSHPWNSAARHTRLTGSSNHYWLTNHISAGHCMLDSGMRVDFLPPRVSPPAGRELYISYIHKS